MTAAPSRPAPDSPSGLHVATIAHDGLLWDTYLDFEGDLRRPSSYRALLRFEPPSGSQGSSTTRTTVLIIEESYAEAVAKARSFDDRQLKGLLRSTLPGEDAE